MSKKILVCLIEEDTMKIIDKIRSYGVHKGDAIDRLVSLAIEGLEDTELIRQWKREFSDQKRP